MPRYNKSFFMVESSFMTEKAVKKAQEEHVDSTQAPKCVTDPQRELQSDCYPPERDLLAYVKPSIVFGATQGKKGHKAPRINMAFSPENHTWIKTRSRQLGITGTDLVNAIVERYRISE